MYGFKVDLECSQYLQCLLQIMLELGGRHTVVAVGETIRYGTVT